jgi:hypothetical protein
MRFSDSLIPKGFEKEWLSQPKNSSGKGEQYKPLQLKEEECLPWKVDSTSMLV